MRQFANSCESCLVLVIGISSCEKLPREKSLAEASTCDPSWDSDLVWSRRHFVRGKRRPPPWWRSSVVDFGRLTERDGGGARDSVSCGHLPLLAGASWWPSARRWSEEPRCPVDVGVWGEPRTWLCLLGSLHPSCPYLFTYRITFPHLLYLACLHFPS